METNVYPSLEKAQAEHRLVGSLGLTGSRKERETVQRIEKRGGRATFVRADVQVRDDLHAMVRFAEDSFGGVDVLVNNAGNTWRPHFPAAQPNTGKRRSHSTSSAR